MTKNSNLKVECKTHEKTRDDIEIIVYGITEDELDHLDSMEEILDVIE